MSIDAQMKLKAAGWRIAPRERDDTPYKWTQDGIDWYTEDEALVVVLTAERDAAIARAERAEAERGDMAAQLDVARSGRETWFQMEQQAIARAEAAEALAASRPEISPEMADEWYAGEPSGAFLAALRAHAAKVSR